MYLYTGEMYVPTSSLTRLCEAKVEDGWPGATFGVPEAC